MNRTIDLNHVTVYLPARVLWVLVSIAVGGFFLGGALTTTFTAASWFIALLIIAYIGWAIYTLQEEMAGFIFEGISETAKEVGGSYEEDLVGLEAAVCDFIDLGRQMILEIDGGTLSIQSINTLRGILTEIGTTEETCE